MTRNPGILLCMSVAFVMGRVGCSQPGPPSEPWAIDVRVTDDDWKPLPETIDVPAGHFLDLTVSFRAGRQGGMMGQLPVRSPEEWRVGASVLTEDGAIAVPSLSSFHVDFPDATKCMGSARQFDGSLIWVSPEPPQDVQPGTRYFWGRIQMPKLPGTYRLVVSVYPTATSDRSEPNPFMDQPAEEIYSTLIDVVPSTDPPPFEGYGVEEFNPIAYRLWADELKNTE